LRRAHYCDSNGGGHLDPQGNDSSWSNRTIANAAAGGYLECLRYSHNHSCL